MALEDWQDADRIRKASRLVTTVPSQDREQLNLYADVRRYAMDD